MTRVNKLYLFNNLKKQVSITLFKKQTKQILSRFSIYPVEGSIGNKQIRN